MRLDRHDILFEPLPVGGKVFRNRFYSVPHASFHPGRRLSDIAFRRTKAEGGWAAVCSGVVSIRSDSWGGFVPRIWDADDRAFLARLAGEVQGQGALAGIELGHAGARGEGAKFEPSLGASQVRDTARSGWVPKAMDLDDIRRLQDEWVAAAVTAADLGYDIVYAYGAHGMLPAQFLSPYFNRRTDAYGGSLENRGRFWLEMIERLRAAIGDRCLVAARVAAENFTRIGVSASETLDFIRMADDLVDLWDVNVGHLWARDSAAWRVASEGYQVEWSGRVRSVTAKPIVGVGRLTTPDAMVDILRSGLWDFVGGARPGIADPFLPRKIEAGRYDEIRECTGGNFCISVETTGNGLTCMQNSSIGEEYRRGWHPEQFSVVRDRTQNVLVVGAGPAGLECTRVLGERRISSVHLVDAGDAVGGHVRWLRALPGAEGFGRVVDYRSTQLGRLDNVTVILNCRLGAEDVRAYGADIVVVATGSHWIGAESDLHQFSVAELEAAGLAVLTPEAVMVEGRRPSGRVVVWDADGGAVAVGLAEKLAAGGGDVTIVTPFDVVGAALDATFDGWMARRRLHDLGVKMTPGTTPARYSEGELVVIDQFGDESVLAASSLVVVSHRVSDDALYHELHIAGTRNVWRAGDCLAPRPLGFTIADGHRLGREIDSATPGIPQPPRDERDADAASASFELVTVAPRRRGDVVKSFSQSSTIAPMIAAEALAAMKELASQVPPWPDNPGVADRRIALEAVFGVLPREPIAESNDLVIPTPTAQVRGRRYANASAKGLLVFFHGGAWVAGSIQSHDGICRALANRSGAVVLSVEYRLAPEHPFPAGLHDAEVAIRWAVEHRDQLGCAGGGVAIGGDSAGATFCAVAALSLRGSVSEELALQVLVYPATDLTMSSETWATMGEGYLLTRDEVEWSLQQYSPPDRADWRVSPLLAEDVSGVPRALIITAECDPLRAEAEGYGHRLVASGVPVTVHRYPGMVHGFVGLAGLQPSEQALDEIASEVRRAVAKVGS